MTRASASCPGVRGRRVESARSFVHTGEARRGVLGSRRTRKLWPRRPFAQRARAIGILISIHDDEASGRLPFFHPILERHQAVELRVEPAKAVAETGNLVKAQEAVQALLTKLGELPLVIFDRVMGRNEIVGGTVG